MSRMKLEKTQGGLYLNVFALRWVLCHLICFAALSSLAQSAGEEVGIPWTGSPGVTETISDIMANDKNLPLQSSMQPAESDEGRLLPNRSNLKGNPRSPHG